MMPGDAEHEPQEQRALRERRRHLPRALRGLFVVTSLFGMLAGYVLHRGLEARQHPPRQASLQGTWIKAPGPDAYAGYFRHSFFLDQSVANAWVRIAARDGFEVTVNGNPVARSYLWRPTRPFQNGLSEKGQRITSAESALALNFPREYQWSGHDSFRLPTLIDIRRYLRPGPNVLCVQIESRRAPANFVLDGAITTNTGETIPLRSGVEWKAAAVPIGSRTDNWPQPDFEDTAWQSANPVAAPRGALWQTCSPNIYSQRFKGEWIGHPQAQANDSVWFRGAWEVTDHPNDAWLRIATNRYFDLYVNNVRVHLPHHFPPDLDSGQWLLERQRGLDPQSRPTLLDPDELNSPFVGHDFEHPAAGDPTTHDFRWLPTLDEIQPHGKFSHDRFAVKSARVAPQEGQGTWEPELPSVPIAVMPQSSRVDRQHGGFMGYDVTRLMRPGHNTVEIRLAEPEAVDSRGSAPRLALDGEAVDGHGNVTSFGTDGRWLVQRGSADTADWQTAAKLAKTTSAGVELHQLQYRGAARSNWADVQSLVRRQLSIIAICWLICVCLLVTTRLAAQRREWMWRTIKGARRLYGATTVATSVLVAQLLVACSFGERHEILWLRQPGYWFLVWSLAWTLGAIVLIWNSRRLDRRRAQQPLTSRHGAWLSWRGLPKSPAWPWFIYAVLLLAFVVRAHRLDFQPLDDDEYASTQAIVAIVESGIPQFVPRNVWYTRSPLFHYLIAGIAWCLGPHLWSMRLPCVAFGVATCWLTYLCGSHLLKNPWLGLAALFLMAIHPFEVYTSHVIRFYQMQQFLALLTVYCFCKGFVTEQSQTYRYATVAAFLATTLTQEISGLMGISLLLGYLVFAQDKGWRDNLKLVTASLCALALIGLDYLVFKTRCMTRLEGVSPNLEATVMLHFWHPYNFLSLFIGYSRLHIVGSLLLLLGLPWMWRQRHPNTMALLLILFSGVFFTNILVTHVSLRYQYWLIPIWVLLSLEGARIFLWRAAAYGVDLVKEPRFHTRVVAVSATVLFAAMVLSFSPWRMIDSYDLKLLGDSTGALQFIRCHLREGDAVMITEPHTHAALMELGRVDYDLSVPLLYDYATRQDGRLIDRNAGAEVIGNLASLKDTLNQERRVWIAVNREKFRNRGKSIRWEYPAARVEQYLRRNCQLAHQSYLWSVYLWDAGQGRYVPFREDRL